VVSPAGPIGVSAKGENNYADGPASCAKNLVIVRDHAIRVVKQILRIRETRRAECWINEYCYSPATYRRPQTGRYQCKWAIEVGPGRHGKLWVISSQPQTV
jgi:hypothetical protein